MNVCRTCLQELSDTNLYSLDQISEENSEISNNLNTFNLRKMIEKCIPEMDMDICDRLVICENCCKLLKNAYKFRNICIPTEEKIYQYVEKNNLRLGESIDLNNISDKHMYQQKYSLIEEYGIKKENDVSIESEDDMPVLHPEIEVTSEPCKRQLIIKLCRESECKRINRNMAQPTLHRTHEMILLKKHLNKCSDKTYKCDKCSYTTLRTGRFNRHKFRHVDANERKKGVESYGRVVCGVCNKSFADKWYLRVHMLKHQPERDHPFKCKEKGCKYTCPRQCDLTAHMSRHVEGFPYICRVCNKLSFTQKGELLEHEKICARKKRGIEKSIELSNFAKHVK